MTAFALTDIVIDFFFIIDNGNAVRREVNVPIQSFPKQMAFKQVEQK